MFDARQRSGDRATVQRKAELAPGRRTLTESLPAQAKPVQAKAAQAKPVPVQAKANPVQLSKITTMSGVVPGSVEENRLAFQSHLDQASPEEVRAIQGSLFLLMIQSSATEFDRWAYAQTQARQQQSIPSFNSGPPMLSGPSMFSGPPMLSGPLGNPMFGSSLFGSGFGSASGGFSSFGGLDSLHSMPSSSGSFGASSSLIGSSQPSSSKPQPKKPVPPGADKEGSALADAYKQLLTLGLDDLADEERASVWKRVAAIELRARDVFDCGESWDDDSDRASIINFGLLFSPFLSPEALIAQTGEYNELDLITTGNDIAIRSVFIVDDDPRDTAFNDPASFPSKHPITWSAIQHACNAGLRIYIASEDDPAERLPGLPQTSKPGLLDSPHLDVSTTRNKLAGNEIGGWDELNHARDEHVRAAPSTINLAGVELHVAPMALITALDVTDSDGMDFFQSCVTNKLFPDGGRGMRCASLIGGSAVTIAMKSDGVIALELAAQPKHISAMVAEDLQSPDPRGSGVDMAEYHALALEAQLVAQHVQLMAASVVEPTIEPNTTQSSTPGFDTTLPSLELGAPEDKSTTQGPFQLAEDPDDDAPDTADEMVAQDRGAGSPLPDDVRAKMERALGADFRDVRIHEDDAAAQVGALAFAQGDHVHFAPGQYAPQSPRGQELLGHELAHVVQQRAGRVATPQGKGAPINADPSLEAEADHAGAKAARGEFAHIAGSSAAPTTSSATQAKAIQRAVGFELEIDAVRTFALDMYRYVHTVNTGGAEDLPGHLISMTAPDRGELIANGPNAGAVRHNIVQNAMNAIALW